MRIAFRLEDERRAVSYGFKQPLTEIDKMSADLWMRFCRRTHWPWPVFDWRIPGTKN